MNCKHAKEQISLFLDERLDPGSQSKLNEHLESCSDCSSYLDDLKAGLVMLHGEAMEKTSDNFEWNLRRKIQLAMAQKERFRLDEPGDSRDLWRFGLSAAAALVIVVASGTFWYQNQFESGSKTDHVAGAMVSGGDEATRQGRPGWIDPVPGAAMPVLDRAGIGYGTVTEETGLEHARPQAASPADSVIGQDHD